MRGVAWHRQADSSRHSGRFAFSERAQPIALDAGRQGVHGYVWRPPSARAVMVLVHGLQSHAQWFAEAADWLADQGVCVYALDRHGSGSSPGRRGDIDRYSQWFDEVAAMVGLAGTEHPGVPIHLVGHCFGANVALGYALREPARLRSLVMLTPGLSITPGYRVREKLQILVAAWLAPERRFRVPQDDELFTGDAEVLDWIRGDTLGARTLTARCLWQINRMRWHLRRQVGGLAVPLLVLEAASDRIADNRRNRKLLARALGSRWRAVSFDAEHFLLAEPCRDHVLEALVTWVTHEPS